jgi:asparagine synthetase B (glutamine-hydrolysing)
LDGEFVFVLLDVRSINKPLIIAARDPIGTRPIFIASSENSDLMGFSSEMKTFDEVATHVKQFPPGHYMITDILSKESYTQSYYNFDQCFLFNIL